MEVKSFWESINLKKIWEANSMMLERTADFDISKRELIELGQTVEL